MKNLFLVTGEIESKSKDLHWYCFDITLLGKRNYSYRIKERFTVPTTKRFFFYANAPYGIDTYEDCEVEINYSLPEYTGSIRNIIIDREDLIKPWSTVVRGIELRILDEDYLKK